MRYLLLFLGLAALAACSADTTNSGQRLDFVGNARLTSSNRTGLGPADTLASRIYAEAADNEVLTRLRITVQYAPRRNPFLYRSLSPDSVNTTPDSDFIYLDTLLTGSATPRTFLFTSVFGVRTTTGAERWQYELRDANDAVRASRAFQLRVRRNDSTLAYQDYTLKLPVPASGVGARRFLQLRAGLALPAYTVLGTTTSLKSEQADLQGLTDLIVLPDGLTLTSPDAAASAFFSLNTTRWPLAARRATRIFRTGSGSNADQNTSTLNAQTTEAGLRDLYNAAAVNNGTGQQIGPVAAGQLYAFYTADKRYGLLQILSIPTSTLTSTSAGLQVRVRMAKYAYGQ